CGRRVRSGQVRGQGAAVRRATGIAARVGHGPPLHGEASRDARRHHDYSVNGSARPGDRGFSAPPPHPRTVPPTGTTSTTGGGEGGGALDVEHRGTSWDGHT